MAPPKRGRPPKQNSSATDGQRLKRKRKSPPAPVIERQKRDLSAVGKTLSKMEKQAGLYRERVQQQRIKEFRQRERKWDPERIEEEARSQAAKAQRNAYHSDLSDEDAHLTVKQELPDDEPESSHRNGQPVLANGPPFSFFELDSVMDPKQEIVEETSEGDEASSRQDPIVMKPTEESPTDAEPCQCGTYRCQVDVEQPTTEEPTMDASTETAAAAVEEPQSSDCTPSQASGTSRLAASTPLTVTPVAEGQNASTFFNSVFLQPANPPLENTEGAPLDRSEHAHGVETINLTFKPRSLLAGRPKHTSFTHTRGAFDIVDSIALAVDTPKATTTPRHTRRHHDEPAPSDAESDQRTDTTDAPHAEGTPAKTTTAMPHTSEVCSPADASPRVDSMNQNVARKQLVVLSECIWEIEHLDRELQRAVCDVEDEFSKQTTALLRHLNGRVGTRADLVDIRRPVEKRLSSFLADVQKKLGAARCMADSVSRTLANLDVGLRDAWDSLSEKDRCSLQGNLVEMVQENMRLETALKLLEQRPASKQKEALFARLGHMSKRFDEYQQAVRDARRKLCDTENRLEKKRRSVKSLEAENERLKADVANKGRELAQAEANAQAQSVRQLDAAEKTIEWYREGVSKLQAQLDHANNSMESAENLFAEKSTNCQALGQQVEELKGQLAVVKSEAERERAAAQLIRDTVNELKTELGAKDVRISQLEEGATANAMPQSTSGLEKRVEQLTVDLEKAVADKGTVVELANQRLMQLVEAQVATTQQKGQMAELEEQLAKALETAKGTEYRLAGATFKYTKLEQRLAAARVCTQDRIKVLRTDMEKEKAAAVELATQRLGQLEESQRTITLQHAMIGSLQAQLDKSVHQIAQLRRQHDGKSAEQTCKAFKSQIDELRAKLVASSKEAFKVPDLSEKISQLEPQLQRTDADLDAARVEALKVPALQVKIAEEESQSKVALDEVVASKALVHRLVSVVSRSIVRPRMVEQQRKQELAKSQKLVAILQSQLDAATEKKDPADCVESLRDELEDSKAKLAEALEQVERLQSVKECFKAIGDNYRRLYKEAEEKRQFESAHAPPPKKPRTEL